MCLLISQRNLHDILQGGHINILRKYTTCTADSNFRTFITEGGFLLPVLIFFFQVVSLLDYIKLNGNFPLLHISFLRACPLWGMAKGPGKGRIHSPWQLRVCPLTGEIKPGAGGDHTESIKKGGRKQSPFVREAIVPSWNPFWLYLTIAMRQWGEPVSDHVLQYLVVLW